MIEKNELYKIEDEILSNIDNLYNEKTEKIYRIDGFVESKLFIQEGRKNVSEILTYTKYTKKDYLLSYYYGMQSFKINKNSHGIMYAILSLLHLKLYEQAQSIYNKNEDKVLEMINSNKFKIDEFIDILIFFNIPMMLVDDICNKLDLLKDFRKRYAYILINIMNDKRKEIKSKYEVKDIENCQEYIGYINEIRNILRDLDLHQLEYIYEMKLQKNQEIDLLAMIPCDGLEHHICKAIIDLSKFEKNSFYSPNKVTKYNFKDEHVEIISNKQNSMASMHMIRIGDKCIVLDCGAEMNDGVINKINMEKFFRENNIKDKHIDAIIITHAHLDHYGSIESLQKYTDKIYMTKDTYSIVNIVNEKINIEKDKLVITKPYDNFKIGEFEIEFIPMNHIKGSIGVCIKWEDKKLFYTGDFSFNRQATTINIQTKDMYRYKDIDYLIMESTYGKKEIEIPYKYKKKLLNYFTNLSVKNNTKVFIPAFAIGRAQECYDIINRSTIEGKITVDGLATQISEYYSGKVIVDNEIKYQDYETKYLNNDIIIASGGVLNNGSASDKYYNLVLNSDEIVTFIKVGYIDKFTYDKKIKPYDSYKINVIDISLSAHAAYEDLIRMIETIKPKNLIFVHGDGIEKYN